MWISIAPKLGGRRALKRFSKTVLRGNWQPRTMGYLPQHERRQTRPRMRAQYALCGLPSPLTPSSRHARPGATVIIRSNRGRTPAATERNRFGKAAFVVTASVSQGKKSDRLEGAAHFRLRAPDEQPFLRIELVSTAPQPGTEPRALRGSSAYRSHPSSSNSSQSVTCPAPASHGLRRSA
jgi:hypothetical protein